MQTESVDELAQGGSGSAEQPDSGPGPGTVIRERYRLQSLIGRGGMGIVYRALDLSLKREVAIKILRDSANKTLRERFLREAQLASRVQHPHTVYVIDFGALPDGACFLAMELLSGRTLAAALAECGAMPPPRACRIGAMIVKGMQSIHAHGILHRDLKPSNIFLLDTENTPDFVKIVDFGVAKELGASLGKDCTLDGTPTPDEDGTAGSFTDRSALTRPGAIVGTPRCMAPEQLRGEPLDARADEYAFGCILYEMLTGVPPFPGDMNETMRGHLYGELVPPRMRRPKAGISRALEAVVLRAMARRPQDRYDDLRLLAAALQLEGERRQPRAYMAWAQARSKLWAVSTLALAMVGSSVGILQTSALQERKPQLPVKAALYGPLSIPLPAGPIVTPPAPHPAPQASPHPAAVSTPAAVSEPLAARVPTAARTAHLAISATPAPASTLVAQAEAAFTRNDLFSAQRLLEAVRRSCQNRSALASAEAADCALAAPTTALFLGRVHEAAGQWAEAVAEYSQVLKGPFLPNPSAQMLAFRAEAEVGRMRLLPRLGRVVLTHVKDGRCEEVSMLLPPGEHLLALDGEDVSITLRARETRRLGSCSLP